jgi:tetratricopeptide (TPR) repeat protein
MTPAYRKMILKGEVKKVGELSSAFMAPPTPAHLQFAYFQSSLVVEYIVEKYGTPALMSVLKALGEGVEINQALAQATVPLPELEKAFADYILGKAKAYGNKLDWEEREPSSNDDLSGAGWAQSTNNLVLRNASAALLEKNDWAGAEKVLQRWLSLHPGPDGSDQPWAWLARVQRELGCVEDEAKLLAAWADRDSEAVDAYDRLIVLAINRGDWAEVEKQALRAIGVNPMRWETYERLAQAQEQLMRPASAARAWARVVALHPPHVVAARYDWARMLFASGDRPSARQQVLEALEEAPRFKNAQNLLLQLQ